MKIDFPEQYRVPYDGTFRVSKSTTAPPDDAPEKDVLKVLLDKANDRLYELQRVLYAHNRYSVLLVFQAMDAAGKDSTIRTVMRGVNPAGCQVYSFKQPSTEELEHDFLWRSATRLPENGRIGIFNRSYYEEVLVVRVHPEYLEKQNLVGRVDTKKFWKERFESIRDHESHLSRNGTVVIKFWLNVSREEQKRRFIDRLEDPAKNWKFSTSDVEERNYWDNYMDCYQDALNQTSRSDAPWYAIPADDKPFMRLQVAKTIIETLESLDIHYPVAEKENRDQFDQFRKKLEQD